MALRSVGGNITRTLAEHVGKAIVRGEYIEGDRLPTEAELAIRHQASRTVTREAIKMLTAKGLISSWPKRGTFVQEEARWNLLDADVLSWLLDRRLTGSLVQDFLTMRLAIEPVAASMAAASSADTAEIALALGSMRRAELGIGDSLEADSAFHAAVLRASGNRFFAQMAPLVATALRMTVRLTNGLKGVGVASVDDHERIFKAISAGRTEEARNATETMIQEALSLIRSRFVNAQEEM